MIAAAIDERVLLFGAWTQRTTAVTRFSSVLFDKIFAIREITGGRQAFFATKKLIFQDILMCALNVSFSIHIKAKINNLRAV